MSGDKTYRDITSGDVTSVGQRFQGTILYVRKDTEDNTFGDKISLRTKRLEEKTSRDKASFWDILLVPILGIFYYSNEKIC